MKYVNVMQSRASDKSIGFETHSMCEVHTEPGFHQTLVSGFLVDPGTVSNMALGPQFSRDRNYSYLLPLIVCSISRI